MAVGIPGFTFATPVTSYQQGMGTGQVLQQNALTLQNNQQQASDQGALRNALSQGMAGDQDAQNAAAQQLAQTAPGQVGNYENQVGAIQQAKQQQLVQKAQQVAQHLGQLAAIPNGPQREAAYQQMLDGEQQQGFDVGPLRNMPANQGIQLAFARIQSIQQQEKAMQPQSFNGTPGQTRYTTDPMTGQTTTQQTPYKPEFQGAIPTGQMVNGQPVTQAGFVAPGQPFQALTQGAQGYSGGNGPVSNPGGVVGAIQNVESANNPNAVSAKGAQGLMQLMPSTAANPGFGIQPAQDGSPQENQRVGSQYFQAMMQKYGGNMQLALAAYNAGPGQVDAAMQQAGGDPQKAITLLPNETQRYIPAVMNQLGTMPQGGQQQAQNAPTAIPAVETLPQGGQQPQAPQNASMAQNAQLPFGASVKQAAPGAQDEFTKNKTFADKLQAAGVIKTPEDYNQVLATGKAPSGATTAVPGDVTQTGQSYLQSIPDPAMRALVVQIANGQQQIPKIYRSGKAGEIGPLQLGQMVAQYDPTFDQADPNSRIKSRADFTSGQSAKQIQQLNTLLGHLSGLSGAVDNLDNSNNSTDYNAIANNVVSRFGSPAVTNFNQAAQPAAEEFAAIMKGSGAPTEQEIALQQKNLNPSNTPEQLHGVIGTMAAQVQSRLEALQARAQNGLGPYASKVTILSPAGQQALDQLRQRGLIPSFHVNEGVTTPPPVPSSAPGQQVSAQPTQQSPANAISVPPAAVQMLRQNPSLRAQFDAKYGSGTSGNYLGS